MKKIYTYLTIIILLVAVNKIYGQQNPVLTHYTINPYLYNPAQAGESGYTTFSLHYRNQWIKMPESPDTKILSADGLINNKFGIGGQIIFDKAHIIENYSAQLSYAYYIRMKKNPNKHYLSFGLYGGFKHQRLNFQEATIKDELDPSIFYNGASKTVWDLGAGFLYRAKGFRMGFTAANLAPDTYNYDQQDATLDFRPAYHLYGNVSYDIRFGNKQTFMLQPMILTRYIPNIPFQFDAGLLADWKNTLWIGGGYRFKNAGVWGTIGCRVHDMVAFSYSYEQSIDGYQAALGSSHEVTLSFRFKNDKKDQLAEEKDEFDRIKQNLMKKNKELLDSLTQLANDVDSINNNLKTTEERLEYIENNTDTTIYQGNSIKYVPIGKINYFLNSAHLHKQQLIEAEDIYENLVLLEEKGNIIMIRIVGSASIEGSEEYNMILSTKRTESAVNFLLKKGVNGDLISTSAKGNSEPIVRDLFESDEEDVKPDPEDRYVKVYVLYAD